MVCGRLFNFFPNTFAGFHIKKRSNFTFLKITNLKNMLWVKDTSSIQCWEGKICVVGLLVLDFLASKTDKTLKCKMCTALVLVSKLC